MLDEDNMYMSCGLSQRKCFFVRGTYLLRYIFIVEDSDWLLDNSIEAGISVRFTGLVPEAIQEAFINDFTIRHNYVTPAWWKEVLENRENP